MTKSILNTLLFLLLAISIQAQSSFHISNTFAVKQGQIDREVAPHVTLRNLTNKTIQISWAVKKTNLSSGWQAVVCDHQCYTSLKQSHVFTLGPNQVLHDFKVSFRPNGKEGIGNIEVEMYDVATPTSKKVVTFSGAAQSTTTSINSFAKETMAPQIYPNPAVEYISIKDDYSKVKSVEVYNVVGRKLKGFTVRHTGEQYDVSGLPRGMYMIRMLDGQGAIIRTQRISKYNP